MITDRGFEALLRRAIKLDSQALVRFQTCGESSVNAFVTTPFDVLASRRTRVSGIGGGEDVASASNAVYSARDLLEGHSQSTHLMSWPGALPPADGFKELDTIPVDVVCQLADQGRDLARQFSGPLGPPKSLLDQTVLEVAGGDQQTKILMRAIFACTSLGLIPGIATHPEIPRHLRVAKAGRWTRIDAPFGSIYHSQGLSLLV